MTRSAGDLAVAGTLRSALALFPLGTPETRKLVWVDLDGRETPTAVKRSARPWPATP